MVSYPWIYISSSVRNVGADDSQHCQPRSFTNHIQEVDCVCHPQPLTDFHRFPQSSHRCSVTLQTDGRPRTYLPRKNIHFKRQMLLSITTALYSRREHSILVLLLSGNFLNCEVLNTHDKLHYSLKKIVFCIGR